MFENQCNFQEMGPHKGIPFFNSIFSLGSITSYGYRNNKYLLGLQVVPQADRVLIRLEELPEVYSSLSYSPATLCYMAFFNPYVIKLMNRQFMQLPMFKCENPVMIIINMLVCETYHKHNHPHPHYWQYQLLIECFSIYVLKDCYWKKNVSSFQLLDYKVYQLNQ